jgi:hypothetical protein
VVKRARLAATALGVGLAVVWAGACRSPPPSIGACPAASGSSTWPTFHGDRARLGWNDAETVLTPSAVGGGNFGPLWTSPVFAPAMLEAGGPGGTGVFAAHLYASPLYQDGVTLTAGPYSGVTLGLVYAASSSGMVYAVNASTLHCSQGDLPAGTIVWQAQLGTPTFVPLLDGGLPLGVLSTPVLDPSASGDSPGDASIGPSGGRLYVTSLGADSGWQVWALDVTSGATLPGWPVTIDPATVAAVDKNGPATLGPAVEMSQRSSLALSPGGGLLYVAFGSYGDEQTGWLVTVSTQSPRVVASFSGAAAGNGSGLCGIWSAGGPAVDPTGTVFTTLGNSVDGAGAAQGVWGESLVELDPALGVVGTYTPFNYCQLDTHDIDVGGSSAVLLPALPTSATSTPRLLAFGGKQGNVYLLDRDALPGRTDHRPPCSTDPATDGSLHPPGAQPALGAPGPLNVFGPYTDEYGDDDYGKMRSTPAYFQDAAGDAFLYVTGSTKAAVDSGRSVPPGLFRLRVVTTPGLPAYLAVDAVNIDQTLQNPGSPVVTSNGSQGPIVWVVDENGPRTATLDEPSAPRPVLYAFDGASLRLLWRSNPGDLDVGGKYGEPVVEHGVVFVGTDRVQAFGLR